MDIIFEKKIKQIKVKIKNLAADAGFEP